MAAYFILNPKLQKINQAKISISINLNFVKNKHKKAKKERNFIEIYENKGNFKEKRSEEHTSELSHSGESRMPSSA